MASGGNAIQIALRDVGQGFGNLLSDESRRRQDALLAQQQQGQLSLAQAQLRNQAEVAAAQGQVSLAEVGAQGRYRDQQHAIEQDRTQIARDTLGETREARLQNFGLAERKLTQVDIPTAKSTIGYQDKLGNAAITNANTAATTATSNATRDAAYVKATDAQTAIHKQQIEANGQMVNLSQLNRELEASDPERAKRGKTWMALMTPYGESSLHYTDKATGDVHAAMAIVGPRLEAYKAMEANLGKTVSDGEIRQKIAETYGKMSDIDKIGMPYETYERRAMAMHKNPGLMLQGTQQVDTVTMPALRQHEIAVLTKELKRAPNPEEIKARIAPMMNRRRNEELDEISYRAMGVKPPAAASSGTPPPGTKGLPAPNPANPAATTVFHRAVMEGAIKRGLDPAVALAVIQQESHFSPNAPAEKGGTGGLGQFQERTAIDRKLDMARLRADPIYNLNASLDYLADLKKQHGEEGLKYVEGYNGIGVGAGDKNYVNNVRKWLPHAQQTVAALRGGTPRSDARGAILPSQAATSAAVQAEGPGAMRSVPPALSILPIQAAPSLPGAEGPGAMRTVSRTSGVVTPQPPSLAAAAQPPQAAAPTVPSPAIPQSSPGQPLDLTKLPPAQMMELRDTIYAQVGQNPQAGTYQVQGAGFQLMVTINSNGVIVNIAKVA